MNRDLVLLSCSMARDAEIFAVLARSVDSFAGPEVRHVVIVPGRDLATFQRFASARREIMAQEDVLPVRLRAMPKALSRLSFLHDALRRPLYLTPKLQVVRGWMIQQILKIEFSRKAPCRAVLHVDSDVFFVRPLAAADAYEGDRVRFFRVGTAEQDPAHGDWMHAAAACLGLALQPGQAAHYIENCLPWSRDVAAAMVARIEAVHGRPYHEVLLSFPTISEYFIYGLFADQMKPEGIAASTTSLCHSFWPTTADEAFDPARALAGLKPWQRALAVQSTHALPAAQREAALQAAISAETDR